MKSAEELSRTAEPLKGIIKFHTIFIDSYGTLNGEELSCLKCTVSDRSYNCSSGEFVDYENFDYDELSEDYSDNSNEILPDYSEIDYEQDSYENIEMISADTNLINPGFVGFVHYGGKFIPAEVVSKNKRKKTCFVRFFNKSGKEAEKQLVNLTDMIEFGETEFNEYIIQLLVKMKICEISLFVPVYN